MTTNRFPFRAIADGTIRRASDLRHAQIALGQLFTECTPGTAGRIEHDGEIVMTGVSDTLGWFVTSEAAR